MRLSFCYKVPGVVNTPSPVVPDNSVDRLLTLASSICTVCRHSSAWRLTTVRKYRARWSAGRLRIVSRRASGIVSGGVISAIAVALNELYDDEDEEDGRRRG